MEKFFNFIKKYSIVLLIFILGLSLRLWVLGQQPDLGKDEPSSFYVATSTNKFEGEQFKQKWDVYLSAIKIGKEYSGLELQNALFTTTNPDSSILKDIQNLRKANIDRQHPILYHSILRVWINNLGNFEYKKYLNHARNLNLIFYCLSFFLMIKLLNLISRNKLFINLGLFFAFTNPAGIILDTMAREYALMETFFIATTILFVIVARKVLNNEQLTFWQIIKYSVVVSLFMESGYFSVIYLAIIGLVIFSLILYKKNWKMLSSMGIMLISTIFITILIYPSYFDFCNNNEHYNEVSSSLLFLNDFMRNFNKFFVYFFRYINEKYVLAPIIILLTSCAIFPQSKKFLKNFEPIEYNITILILLLCSVVWGVMVMHVTPYKEFRYIFPAQSIYSLLMVFLIIRLKNKIIYPLVVMSLLLCCFHMNIRNFYNCTDRIKVKDAQNDYTENIIFSKNLPIVFVNEKKEELDYVFEEIIFANIYSSNKVIIEERMPGKDYKYKNYVLFCKRWHKPTEKASLNYRAHMGVYYVFQKKL